MSVIDIEDYVLCKFQLAHDRSSVLVYDQYKERVNVVAIGPKADELVRQLNLRPLEKSYHYARLVDQDDTLGIEVLNKPETYPGW